MASPKTHSSSFILYQSWATFYSFWAWYNWRDSKYHLAWNIIASSWPWKLFISKFNSISVQVYINIVWPYIMGQFSFFLFNNNNFWGMKLMPIFCLIRIIRLYFVVLTGHLDVYYYSHRCDHATLSRRWKIAKIQIGKIILKKSQTICRIRLVSYY